MTRTDPAWEMIRESARESSFVFRPVENGEGAMVEVIRFDTEGCQLLKKLYPLREFEGGLLRRERSKLFSFVSAALPMFGGKPRDLYLVVHPVDPRSHDSILREENYRRFSGLKQRIASQLEIP